MGGPCSRADKLKAALQIHLPRSPDSSAAKNELMSKLLTCIQQTWGMDLGMQKSQLSPSDMLRALVEEVSTVDSSTVSVEPCHAGESSTFSIGPCDDRDPFGGEVVGGLDGDYAYGSFHSS